MAEQNVRIALGGQRYKTAPKAWMIVSPEDADLASLRWSKLHAYAGRYERDGEVHVQVFAHRQILARKLGRTLLPNEVCDHINHDKLDNRRDNLRAVSIQQNVQHRKGAQPKNKSGIRGVSWDKVRKKWLAQVGHMGKGYNCGRYDTPEAAAAAAAAKRKELGFLGA